MGASLCMKTARTIDQPLTLRYLLHAHAGAVDAKRAENILAEFTESPFYEVTPSKAKHRQFELRPLSKSVKS